MRGRRTTCVPFLSGVGYFVFRMRRRAAAACRSKASSATASGARSPTNAGLDEGAVGAFGVVVLRERVNRRGALERVIGVPGLEADLVDDVVGVDEPAGRVVSGDGASARVAGDRVDVHDVHA